MDIQGQIGQVTFNVTWVQVTLGAMYISWEVFASPLPLHTQHPVRMWLGIATIHHMIHALEHTLSER
jgi:hypothetical protein